MLPDDPIVAMLESSDQSLRRLIRRRDSQPRRQEGDEAD